MCACEQDEIKRTLACKRAAWQKVTRQHKYSWTYPRSPAGFVFFPCREFRINTFDYTVHTGCKQNGRQMEGEDYKKTSKQTSVPLGRKYAVIRAHFCPQPREKKE